MTLISTLHMQAKGWQRLGRGLLNSDTGQAGAYFVCADSLVQALPEPLQHRRSDQTRYDYLSRNLIHAHITALFGPENEIHLDIGTESYVLKVEDA